MRQGGYRVIDLGIRVSNDPKGATKDILAAYTEAKCSAVGAANLLNVTYRTFWRYVTKLDLHSDLERLTLRSKREGWFHNTRWSGTA